MILELADFFILPDQNTAFEEAVQRGLNTVIAQAKGFEGFKLNHGLENPQRYILQIFWTTLEDHTVGFRGSPAFAQWRAIVGPFFASAPVVEHFELVAKSA
ncbi:MAG: antibiotic biosynthesis monooxygenase [Betaproteobacteria bacterium HGW-Betaproteobacteria-18]|nr:MAG: antibiotic biosynthesis monooxygenase [Betaproteobacteria bacterium HGW-Betaproteobacteria-18]